MSRKHWRTQRGWTLAVLSLVLVAGLLAAACGDDDDATAEPEDFSGQTLTLITPDSFSISEETIEAFEAQYDVSVALLPSVL